MEIPISHEDYMKLADAYDKYSRTLMTSKGEEYSIDNDFLAMENRLAGMLGEEPEYVSLVMAGKHITAIGIILDKNEPTEINLEKLDERIRDATNLLKITSAFIHAKQKDFSLHLDKKENKEFICLEGRVIKSEDIDNDTGWYVEFQISGKYFCLQKDGQLHNNTGWDKHKFGEAPGYWPTEEAAEDALKQYLGKQND